MRGSDKEDGPAQSAASTTESSALEERRGRAVSAFFVELAGRGAARRLAAETASAFARRCQSGEIACSEESLLQTARQTASRHKLVFAPRAGWRATVMRSISEEGSCANTAGLLAASAEGDLGEADRLNLETHLDACPTCRAAQLRWARGERAFVTVMQFETAAGLVPATQALATPVPYLEPEAPPSVLEIEPQAPAPALPEAEPEAAVPVPVTAFAPPPATAELPVLEPAWERRPRPRRRLATVPVALALAGVAVCAVGAVALLRRSPAPRTSIPVATPSVSTTASPSPPAAPVNHRAHSKRVIHHAARKPHHKPAPKAAPTVIASTAPPAAAVSPPAAPVSSSPPVASPPPAPVASPAPSTGSSGGSPSSVTIHQSGLGASTAPTQGISGKP